MNNLIAIDGPAASGKTSVAKRLAARLGYGFVGTGSMYRALTHAVLEAGIDPSFSEQIEQAVAERFVLEIGFSQSEPAQSWFRVNGTEASEEQLHNERVNEAVSSVASLPKVRQTLLEHQRNYLSFVTDAMQGIVMEGRDIGSVVFPESTNKFYITASADVRNERRRAQGIIDDLKLRDETDSARKHSPLTQAPGAVVIDSSELDLEQTVTLVLRALSS